MALSSRRDATSMASAGTSNIEDAYGESPPPPALLDVPMVAKRCGQNSGKVLDHVFPQPLWKPFGEMWGSAKKTTGQKKKGG